MTKSWQHWLAVVALVSYAGCSKPSAEPTAAKNAANTAPVAVQSAPLITGAMVQTLTPASEVVTLFLDSLKKGNAAQTRSLLTTIVQEEIDRRGLTIDPLGSEESSFRIGRTQFSDKDADAAYVEAEWIEPAEGGQTLSTEVVFTVHLENQAWRISGMAIDTGANSDPVLVDFENMADTLPETSQGVSKATAAAPVQQSPATSATQSLAAPPASSSSFQVPNASATAPAYSAPPQFAQPPNTTGNSLR